MNRSKCRLPPPLQGTMSYVIIYLLCSEPENSQHYNTPDKQVECTLEPLHFSPFVYTPGLDLYCYYVLYSYYAILAERQNNTVQRAHVHANTSTKKTQGDNRLCMKLFKTGSIDVVKYCQRCFATDLPSCDLKRSRVSLYYDTFPQWMVFANYTIFCLYSNSKCQLLRWTWSLFSLCLYLCLRCRVFVCNSLFGE